MAVFEYDLTKKHQLFFLSIPKTAGVSFDSILEQNFDKEDVFLLPYFSELPKKPWGFFKQPGYFTGHLYYDVMCKLLRENSLCITIIREPVERFLSNFLHMQRDPTIFSRLHGFDLPVSKLTKYCTMDLSEFVDSSDLSLVTSYQNCQTHFVGGKFDFETVNEFEHVVETAHKPQLLDVELAKKRLKRFAFFGLTDRFQDTTFLLSYTFGWLPFVDWPRLNVAPRKLQNEKIPPETLDKISKLNTLDLELYVYAQQLFEERFNQMSFELLEQYGQRSHAHVKLPLTQEILYDLLEIHYAQRFAEQHQLVYAINFTFDQAISGTGWHLPEEHPEYGAFRWTGPAIHSTLDFPLATDGSLQIRFSVVSAITSDVLSSLKLYVNQQQIPLVNNLEKNGEYIFKGYIPQAALSKNQAFSRFNFEVDDTLSPNAFNPDNDDTRALGVALSRLEIEPVSVDETVWLRSLLETANNECKNLQAMRDNLAEQSEYLGTKLKAKEDELSSLNSLLQSQKEECNKLQTVNNEAKDYVEILEAALQEQKEEHNKLLTVYKEAVDYARSLEAEISNLQAINLAENTKDE